MAEVFDLGMGVLSPLQAHSGVTAPGYRFLNCLLKYPVPAVAGAERAGKVASAARAGWNLPLHDSLTGVNESGQGGTCPSTIHPRLPDLLAFEAGSHSSRAWDR